MTENEQIFWNRVLELAKYGDDLPGSYERTLLG